VPAAPVLVEDPVRLARAVGQSGGFFQEVLTNSPLAPSKLLRPNMTRGQKVARGPKTAKVNEKAQKELSMEEHFDAYDAVMEAYLNRR
jgi:hypothetical protein